MSKKGLVAVYTLPKTSGRSVSSYEATVKEDGVIVPTPMAEIPAREPRKVLDLSTLPDDDDDEE